MRTAYGLRSDWVENLVDVDRPDDDQYGPLDSGCRLRATVCPVFRYPCGMNIQKLEAVLEEMRVETFADAQIATMRIRNWADRIGDAVTQHLISELGSSEAPSAEAPQLAIEPGGHDWDKPGL